MDRVQGFTGRWTQFKIDVKSSFWQRVGVVVGRAADRRFSPGVKLQLLMEPMAPDEGPARAGC